METYVIRIYRSERFLIGAVEDLFGNGKKIFKNPLELKEILYHYKEESSESEESTAIQRIMEEKVETYVVNIYELGEENSGALEGMIRRSTSKERETFSTFEKLWDLLKAK